MSLGVAAMSFAVATPALALVDTQWGDRGATNTRVKTRTSTTSVTTKQKATLTNTVTSTCNSGDNTISSVFGDVKKTNITSGNATCGSTVSNTVNKADVDVNAPTTVGSESSGPELDQTGDRDAVNLYEDTSVDDVTVENKSKVNATNTQTSDSNTGGNALGSTFGDVGEGDIVSGVAGGVNSLLQNLNTLMLTVTR